MGEQSGCVGSGGVEMKPAEGKGPAAVAVGEQTEVTNFDEACRQDVEQKAADELDRIESHDPDAVVVPGVAPAEAHLAVVETEESSVGNSDAMGIAGQVLQHVFGSAEGRLGIDHPLFSAQGMEQRVEGAGRGEFSQPAGEA